jgi:uncharacterized membrane protein
VSAPTEIQHVVGRVLLGGGLLALILIVAGLVIYVAEGAPNASEIVKAVQLRESGPALDVYPTLGSVRRALAQHPPDGLALTALGLVCLLATPVVGVALAIGAFWRHGDREYTLIAGAILTMLLVSFVLAAAG